MHPTSRCHAADDRCHRPSCDLQRRFAAAMTTRNVGVDNRSASYTRTSAHQGGGRSNRRRTTKSDSGAASGPGQPSSLSLRFMGAATRPQTGAWGGRCDAGFRAISIAKLCSGFSGRVIRVDLSTWPLQQPVLTPVRYSRGSTISKTKRSSSLGRDCSQVKSPRRLQVWADHLQGRPTSVRIRRSRCERARNDRPTADQTD